MVVGLEKIMIEEGLGEMHVKLVTMVVTVLANRREQTY